MLLDFSQCDYETVFPARNNDAISVDDPLSRGLPSKRGIESDLGTTFADGIAGGGGVTTTNARLLQKKRTVETDEDFANMPSQ